MTEKRVFEWHEAKARENLRRGRPPFEDVLDFSFATAIFSEDTRADYGEVRIQAVGYIAERLHVLIYTERGDTIRVISLRKANDREVRRYDRETASRHKDRSDR